MLSSLRSRLILLVLLAVLPALGLALYTGLQQRRQAAIQAEGEALRWARLAAHNQAELIEGGEQLLVALAQIPAVREGDWAACDAFFALLLKQYPYYLNLGVSAPNGDLLCSGAPPSGPVNFAGRDWLRDAIQSGEFVIGEFVIGRVTGEPLLPLAYPGLDSVGQVQYVVFSAIDLTWLNQLAAEIPWPEGSVLTLIDRHGKILARHPDPQAYTGQSMPETQIIEAILTKGGEGFAEASGVDGVMRLYAFTPLGGESEPTRQYVSFGIPVDVAYAEANRTLAIHLAGLGLVTVLSLGAAQAFGNVFILRRMDSLLRATRRLAKGDLKSRTEIDYDQSEMSLLAQAFDGMAEALEQREAERKRADERYRLLFETMMNGFALSEMLLGEDGKPYDFRFLEVNPAFEQIIELSGEEVIGKTLREVAPEIEDYWIETLGSVALTRKEIHYENYLQALGRYLEVFAFSPHEGQLATVFMDITERKRMEDENRRVNRALRTISDCNQALVRATDETRLLEEVCQILTTIGGHRMAWVGYAEQDEAKTVRAVAHAGYEEGYLGSIQPTWANADDDSCPTGMAIRTGRFYKVDDISEDGRGKPWSEAALQRGYASLIAAPLANDGRTFGALTIYADQAAAFEEQEARLLQELADDLAYGIQALRTRAARKKAEQALRESEARYRNTLESMLEGCQIIGFDWRYLYVNEAVAKHGKRIKEELLGKTMMEVYPGIEETDLFASLKRCMDERVSSQLENEFTFPDGAKGWFELGIQPVPEGIFILSYDISERKRAEKVQAAIYRISQAAVFTAGIDELYLSIHQILGGLMPAEDFYIALYDPANDLLSFPYFVDQFDPPFPPQKPGRGLTEYVLRTQSPLLASPEVFNQLVQQGEVELEGTDSVDWVGVPLRTEERVIGVMATQSYNENTRYNQKDMDLLEFVSVQVALAIERKRAEEQIQQNAQRALALAEISEAIGKASLDDQAIVEVVARRVAEEIGEGCAIALTSEDGEWLHPAAFYHSGGEATAFLHEALGSRPARLDEGICGGVAQSGQPALVAGLAPEKTRDRLEAERRFKPGGYVHSVMVAPLRAQGQVIGTISAALQQPGRAYHEDDLAFLQEIGERTAMALLNARLYEQEQALSQELLALNTLSTLLQEAATTDKMLAGLLQEVHQLLLTDTAMVALQYRSHDRLKVALADGFLAHTTGDVFQKQESVSGIVFNTHQPYVTDDYAQEPMRTPDLGSGDEIGPAVFVPLQSESEMLGVLMVARQRVEEAAPFSPMEIRLLTTIGNMVGNSLRRALLFEDSQRHLSRVQALRKIDVAISNSLDLRISMDIILDQVTTQMGIDAACLLLYQSHIQTLSFAAGIGFRTDALKYTTLRLGEGFAGRAALERRIVNVSDLRNRKTELLRSPAFLTEGFIAYLAIPLITKGQVQGVLEIFHRAPLEVDQEWLDFLETLAGQAAIAIDNASLFADLQRSNLDLILAYDATIEGWSHAMDLRDKETEGHTQRVTTMTLRLAKAMNVSDIELLHIRRGALLHDIGKIGVPDTILHKPGALSEEEWTLMRRHPIHAYEMLTPIAYLKPAIDIPYSHHEKWDGTGYPQGLKGEQIPIAARIFAVVDVWDALISDRPYRRAWSKEKALEYIREQAGKHFDPAVVDTFFKIHPSD